MKIRRSLLLIMLTTTLSNPPADATEKLTGKDWPKISEQRKLYYIFGKREEFQEKGVVFTHSAEDYIALLDKTVRQGSASQNKNMDEIFKAAVREKEPGAGEALGP